MADETELWVDPELAVLGQRLTSAGVPLPDPRNTPITHVREAHERQGRYLSSLTKPARVERDVRVGANGAPPARLYRPNEAASGPLLLYFHGGGFAYGALDGWSLMHRALVEHAGVSILSVDYGLAPESPFPVAVEQAVALLRDLQTGDHELGFEATTLAIGGDSAGANLALNAALDAPSRKLRLALLFFGVYSLDAESESWRGLGDGRFGLSQAQMQWVWSNYFARPADRSDPRAAPLHRSLQSLPIVLQIIGTLDPLLDDARALAAKLDGAGVENRLSFYKGVNHGFVRFPGMLTAATAAIGEASDALRKALD